MQQLYNELVSPVSETNDKGELVSKSPTSLMMRAARVIKQADEINATNLANVQTNQQRVLDITIENQKLTEIINQLRKENESLRDAGQKASDVGSTGVLDQRVDPISEEGAANKDSNPSTS